MEVLLVAIGFQLGITYMLLVDIIVDRSMRKRRERRAKEKEDN